MGWRGLTAAAGRRLSARAALSWIALGLATGCDESAGAQNPSASAASARRGPRVRADEPACVKTAQECAYEGRCTPAPAASVEAVTSASAAPAVAARCQATSDEDCRRAQVCRDWGACSARDGGCVVARDEDCQAAWICKRAGQCSADAGKCVVKSDADCKRAEVCVRERKCKAEEGWCKKP